MNFISALAERSGYSIDPEFMEDPEHSEYFDRLYPGPDDWQVIMNLRVLNQMSKHNDDPSISRKIDHFAYFPSRSAAADFTIWAENDRFTEEPGNPRVTDDGRFAVHFFHEGTLILNEITSHTIALRRKAEEFGGDYDGWGASVCTS